MENRSEFSEKTSIREIKLLETAESISRMIGALDNKEERAVGIITTIQIDSQITMADLLLHSLSTLAVQITGLEITFTTGKCA